MLNFKLFPSLAKSVAHCDDFIVICETLKQWFQTFLQVKHLQTLFFSSNPFWKILILVPKISKKNLPNLISTFFFTTFLSSPIFEKPQQFEVFLELILSYHKPQNLVEPLEL